MKKIFFTIILISLVKFGFSCHAFTMSQTSATANGDGTYTYVFQVCMGIESTYGFYLDFTGTGNLISASPASLTGTGGTKNLSTPGPSGSGDLEYGDWDDTGSGFFAIGDGSAPGECFSVTATFDGPITNALVGGRQEVFGNCTGTTTTESCFSSSYDYDITITTYGPCSGGNVTFRADGTTVSSYSQDGSTTTETVTFSACVACGTTVELRAPAGTSGSPSSRCPGGVASYTVTNSSGNVVGSGGGDNSTTYSIIGPTCPLSVELFAFDGENKNGVNHLFWSTSNEIDNAYFVIEKSSDNTFWDPIAIVNGAGTTDKVVSYKYMDESPEEGLNYYRIKDVDIFGLNSFSHSIVIDNINTNAKILVETYNILGQPVTSEFEGFVIDVYSDGTSTKRYKQKQESNLGHH